MKWAQTSIDRHVYYRDFTGILSKICCCDETPFHLLISWPCSMHYFLFSGGWYHSIKSSTLASCLALFPLATVWPYQTIITAAKKLDRLFWGIVMHEIRSNRLVLWHTPPQALRCTRWQCTWPTISYFIFQFTNLPNFLEILQFHYEPGRVKY